MGLELKNLETTSYTITLKDFPADDVVVTLTKKDYTSNTAWLLDFGYKCHSLKYLIQIIVTIFDSTDITVISLEKLMGLPTKQGIYLAIKKTDKNVPEDYYDLFLDCFSTEKIRERKE